MAVFARVRCARFVRAAGRGLVAFHIYQDTVGHWRWYLLADDHRKIANSGGSYMDRGACLVALRLVMGTDVDTPVYED